MGFQCGVQFLGHSRAWQDSSLWNNKVLSGRNILWTDWGVAPPKGSLSSKPEIPVSSFSQIRVRALSWFHLSPADQPSAMLQGFQHSPISMISTQGPCFPCLMSCHKPTHTLTPGSSHTAQHPFSRLAQAHLLQGPSLYPDAQHPAPWTTLLAHSCLCFWLWVGWGIQQSGGASRQEDGVGGAYWGIVHV